MRPPPRSRAVSPRPGRHVQPIEQVLLVLSGRGVRREAEEVGSGEGTTTQVSGQADEEAVSWDLRAMGQQGLTPDLAIRTDIERHRRRLRAWATGMVPPSFQPGRVDTCCGELRPQVLPLEFGDLLLDDVQLLRHEGMQAGTHRQTLPAVKLCRQCFEVVEGEP